MFTFFDIIVINFEQIFHGFTLLLFTLHIFCEDSFVVFEK